MNKEWIIDVMADIREFAQTHSMLALAEKLDDAIFVAACEISREVRGKDGNDCEPAGSISRKARPD